MRALPTFTVDAGQPLDVAMARESLRLRAAQSVHSRTVMVVATCIAGAAFALTVPGWRVLAWAAPIIGLALLNAWLCARLLPQLDAADAQALARHQRTLWCMTVLNQLAVGFTVWWIGAGQDTTLATIATTLQLIYVGGALVNASTHPPTFITGAWINLAIAASFWLAQSGTGWPLAVALVGMGLVMARSSRQTAASFRESLRMRFENAELLRRLEQEKQAAEEANAAKSRFLAAASHDLRQPLHALLVFSTLLHKTQTPQTAELVAHIRSAAGSLDKLFAGLLDLSKLETGAIVPQLQAVHVNALLAGLVSEYEEACRQKGVQLTVAGEPQWVLSDPFLLERVLRNLVDNAVKYTAAGSVRIEVRQGASQTLVSISDTGTGIPEHLQPRIFEEYFQVGNSARDLSKGSGLGLAIVRRLCALLQASLELQSEPGRGSTFTVQLHPAPIDDSATSPAAVAAEQPLRLQGVRVWLVEDNDLVRLATQKALEDLGCQVEAFRSLLQVPEAAQRPDALVADYRLEGEETGLRVAQRLRTAWPALPVAIITGDPAIDRSALEEMGKVVMLQKPVAPAVLGKWLLDHCRPAPQRDDVPLRAAPADHAMLTP
ncbi:MAG TPA: hybrid sensor histidine kinase/response regulator [Ramlibacter sp.]|nr:hybrid sensor histidine kinase/response regulator [Ramlibacter sp.]